MTSPGNERPRYLVVTFLTDNATLRCWMSTDGINRPDYVRSIRRYCESRFGYVPDGYTTLDGRAVSLQEIVAAPIKYPKVKCIMSAWYYVSFKDCVHTVDLKSNGTGCDWCFCCFQLTHVERGHAVFFSKKKGSEIFFPKKVKKFFFRKKKVERARSVFFWKKS